jgi:hypothetical protein
MNTRVFSIRAQRVMVWSALIMGTIFGVAWMSLLRMMPPPGPELSAQAITSFYQANSFQIKLGAMVASWMSGFLVLYAVVMYAQIRQFEENSPLLSVLALVGGCLMSIFIVLPPLFWGIAAFTPDRAPELTSLMHEIACLTLVTTDQYYIFNFLAVAFFALRFDNPLSPFPRWFGYFTFWGAVIFEVGALGFMFKDGPFAWDGLFVFWLPVVLFFVFIPMWSYLILGALQRQEAATIRAS